MTKFRGRLLITLILAAVALSVTGVGTASARAPLRGSTVGEKPYLKDRSRDRTPIGTYSGEPDAGSGSVPKTTSPTSGAPTDTSVVGSDLWLLFWAIWVARN